MIHRSRWRSFAEASLWAVSKVHEITNEGIELLTIKPSSAMALLYCDLQPRA